jgi:hypothetical protein
VGVLLVTTLACAEATTPQAYSGVQAPAITSTALRPTVEQAQVDVHLSGIQAQHTLDAVHGAQTATAEAQAAQIWALTITAEARAAEATATAWPLTVEAARAQATATAQAEAQATARAVAWEQATATAEARQAALSYQMTVEAWHVTLTAVSAEQAAVDAVRQEEIQRESLATRREQVVYPVRAFGPWIILLVLLVLLVYGVVHLVRVGDERGRVVKVEPHEREIILQSGMIVQPSRSPGAVLVYNQQRSLPPPSQEDQRETTRRAQIVEGLRALHPPASSGGRALPTSKINAMMKPTAAPPAKYSIRVVEPQRVGRWLADVRPKFMSTVIEGEVRDVDHEG